MNLNQTTRAVSLLVEDREQSSPATRELEKIFFTVSPNPNLLIEVMKGRQTRKVRYGSLPQRVQYDYCVKHTKESIIPFMTEGGWLVGCAELNQKGHVHFHMLICDPKYQSEQQLHVFRRDISWCPISIKNRKTVNDMDYMNNIVYAEDYDDLMTNYFTKDPYGPNYWYDGHLASTYKGRNIGDLLRIESEQEWFQRVG